MQVELCMKKLWRLSGYSIPKEEEDSCCKKRGALARLGGLVGAGGADGEHKEHKDAYALCDSGDYKAYRGW